MAEPSVGAPPAPSFALVVRQSPDWGALDAAGGRHDASEFEQMLGFAPGLIARMVELWNGTFPVSFYRIRQRLKDIAFESFAAVRGIERLGFDAYLAQPSAPTAYYLFTDDDDWFAPHVLERLSAASIGELDLVIWGSIRFRGGFKFRQIRDFCYTNNYVIRGTLAPAGDVERGRFAQHGVSQGLIADARIRRRVIPDYFSITNKHPASASMMGKALQDDLSADRLVESVRRYVERSGDGAIPHGCEWAAPYVARSVATFEALLP
jgi:hypothetical protein